MKLSMEDAEFTVDLGDDNAYTFKKAYVQRVDITTTNRTEMLEFDGSEYKPKRGPNIFEVRLDLICKEMEQHSVKGNKRNIAKKQVKDCSIQELLFAIRVKAKKK